MPDMSKHALPEAVPRHRSPVPPCWVVLCAMGTASVACQMYHAYHSGTLWVFAIIEGAAPVIAAMGLSHAAALLKSRWWLKVLVFGVILCSMVLSARAIAQVVLAGEGPWGAWLFGAMLDGAALTALAIILTEHERQAEREAARAQEERAMQVAALAAASSPSPLPRRQAGSPRKRAAVTGGKQGGGSARKPEPELQAVLDRLDLDGLDTEAAALRLLEATGYAISGNAIGRATGVSEARGRQLKRKLTAAAPATGPMQRVGG